MNQFTTTLWKNRAEAQNCCGKYYRKYDGTLDISTKILAT
jgi:hypothetical protein